MSEMQDVSTQEPDARGEYLKFGLMAAILLGTVLVIALLRPLIFDKIVPAVMGAGQPTAPMPVETQDQPLKETPTMEAVDAPMPTDMPEESNEAFIPAITVEGEEGVTTTDTAVETMTTIPHTVQPGETLTAIAQQYGVTVDLIIEANAIAEPNHITVGTILQIPQP